MGQLHEFTCSNCKYTCDVSGKEDCGKFGHPFANRITIFL
jgi:hypothetical protein